jgi:hypothetical protein
MSVSEVARELESGKQIKVEENRDYLCVSAILAIIFVRFFQTIVLAKPISRLFLVSVWDSLFYPNRVGHSLPVDYAAILLLLPYKFFVAEYWHHAVPLWNQFNGFGMPLLADPQALVFSPMLLFFYLFPSLYTWNLTLVAILAVGAISTYFLCRELEFDFIAGLVSALLFVFCPWVQWQVEPLGAGICLTPFVLLFFARAGKRKSLWNTVIAGVAAAIDVLSSHPEVCFVTITFACLLMGLVAFYQDKSRFNLLSTLSRIALAGIVAIGISAPMLVPFVEYLHNGETYKFDRVAPTDISWQALVANYLYPFFSVSSPYLGPLSWLGLLVAVCFPKNNSRFWLPLFGCFAISTFAIAKLFPLNLILRIPPLSAVQPMYCFPEYLVFMSLISGLGISLLVSGLANVSKAKMVIAAALGLAFLAVPIVCSPWHHDCSSLRFDQILQASHFHSRIWLLNVVCLAVMLLVWRLTAKSISKRRTIGWGALIGLGILNLAVVSFFSLPPTPRFEYPRALPINIATPNSARFISLGDHLFRPNTNQIYKLPTIRVHNPLFPKGFIAFMRACGAEFDDFNQYFPASISRLLDLTGTGTILSEQPLLDEAATLSSIGKTNVAKQPDRQVNYLDTMNLSRIRLLLDAQQKAVYCCLRATPNPSRGESYHLDCKIEDSNGNSLCFIESQPITAVVANQAIIFSAFLPKSAKDWTLSLRLKSDKDSLPIQPDTKTSDGSLTSEGNLFLASSKHLELFTAVNNKRFKQESHYGGSIVAYENRTALNRCFFVKDVQWVKESTDALEYLKSHSNDLGNTAVLEDFQKNQFDELIGNKTLPLQFDQSGSIKILEACSVGNFPDSATLDLQTECPNASLLVVSDLCYPGWKVLLDGKEWHIFHADSIFRAVIVPSGKHQLRFKYSPLSFTVGLLLFGATSLILLFVFIINRYKHA